MGDFLGIDGDPGLFQIAPLIGGHAQSLANSILLQTEFSEGRSEESKVGRGVVEKARQDTGNPEEAGFVFGRSNHGGQGTILPGFENGQRRNDRHEDAGEDIADLLDGEPGEAVGLAQSPWGELE